MHQWNKLTYPQHSHGCYTVGLRQMKIIEQTITSLGYPSWIESLDRSHGRDAVIARWRHGSARVAISQADAIRVAVSLSSGQQVRYAERDQAVSTCALAGHVTVFPAGISSETTIEGEADVIQIFLRPESLGPLAGRAFGRPPLIASTNDELRHAAIQLLVAARHCDWNLRGAAEGRLRQIVGELLVSSRDNTGQGATEGLPPITVRKVESLIAGAMNSYDSGSPNLAELAATARLSVNQFIRVFRRATGTTPHQLVMARRCERAMDLLRRPTLTVADVSDAAGYSSPAHFVAAFRQRLGATPGAYRRAVGGGQQADR
jgi:AraC family transcriptional regulator